MRYFVESIQEDREPLAGVDLAVDCVEVIYAAYLSAAEGRRVVLAGRQGNPADKLTGGVAGP